MFYDYPLYMTQLTEFLVVGAQLLVILMTSIAGVYVFFIGIKRRKSALIYIGMFYLIITSSNIIRVIFDLRWVHVVLFQAFAPFMLLEFTRRTFLRGRTDAKNSIRLYYSAFMVFYILASIFGLLHLASNFEDRQLYNIAAFFDILGMWTPMIFTIKVSTDALKDLDPKIVERYIIKRIEIWRNLGYLFGFTYGLNLIEITNEDFYPYVAAFIAILSVPIGFITLFLWVLPESFKNYLNKGSEVEREDLKTEEMSDEELDEKRHESLGEKNIEILWVLGGYLAQMIDTSELACRGHIRIAAKNRYPNLDLNTLNYKKWLEVLDEPLVDQLDKVKVQNTSEICGSLKSEFLRTQAVITMA